MVRRYVVLAIALACVVTGTAAAASAHVKRESSSLASDASLSVSHSESEVGAGTLSLRAELQLQSVLGACPSPLPDGASDCARRTIRGPFPGLGQVTGTYEFVLNRISPPCPLGTGKALSYPIRLQVATKGEIHLTVAEGNECLGDDIIFNQTQNFAITGGTGIYAGASGSGTLERLLGSASDSGRFGTETWSGTLTVPSLEFDTTAPTLSGARAKTVRAKKRAKNVRVVFAVTAQDDKDGALAAACTPRSGSRFKVGRTRVSCSATDSSGNRAAASFTVTVKRAR